MDAPWATIVIARFENQITMVNTYSVSLIGGALAFYSKMMFDIKVSGHVIRLRGEVLFVFFLLLEFLSIACGYIAIGIIAAGTPWFASAVMPHLDVSLTETIRNSPISHLNYFSFGQLVLFIVGFLCLIVFSMLNWGVTSYIHPRNSERKDENS